MHNAAYFGYVQRANLRAGALHPSLELIKQTRRINNPKLSPRARQAAKERTGELAQIMVEAPELLKPGLIDEARKYGYSDKTLDLYARKIKHMQLEDDRNPFISVPGKFDPDRTIRPEDVAARKAYLKKTYAEHAEYVDRLRRNKEAAVASANINSKPTEPSSGSSSSSKKSSKQYETIPSTPFIAGGTAIVGGLGAAGILLDDTEKEKQASMSAYSKTATFNMRQIASHAIVPGVIIGGLGSVVLAEKLRERKKQRLESSAE